MQKETAGCASKQEIKEHRQELTALLESNGWSWEDGYGSEKDRQGKKKPTPARAYLSLPDFVEEVNTTSC